MEVDGDSLSYQDMMERQMNEEHRRQRERAIMEDGRAMWQQKKREQFELELKEQDEVRNQMQISQCLENYQKLEISIFNKSGSKEFSKNFKCFDWQKKV